jgi:hypothetical protein
VISYTSWLTLYQWYDCCSTWHREASSNVDTKTTGGTIYNEVYAFCNQSLTRHWEGVEFSEIHNGGATNYAQASRYGWPPCDT